MLSRAVSFIRIISDPAFWAVTARHWSRFLYPIRSDNDHLRATIRWLSAAHDATGKQGVSAGYDFRRRWLPPYPETTGYIIPTFLRYYRLTGDKDFLNRAIKMGEWEIQIQLPSGAVRGGIGINDYPVVFNTGQVIQGWVTLYSETREDRYIQAAQRSGDWLVSIQEPDGSWIKSTYNNRSHSYHSLVDWSLFQLAEATGEERYKEAAFKNINWILSQMDGDSWINYMGFSGEDDPLTHTIAYTIQGLLESSAFITGEKRQQVISLVQNMAEKAMHTYERDKYNPYGDPMFLSATLNRKWHRTSSYSCLTGNAQLAIVWLRLYEMFDDARLLNASLKIIDQLKSVQDISTHRREIFGGVPGSYPIWGQYMKLMYPNWAAKYFADALMLQMKILPEKSI